MAVSQITPTLFLGGAEAPLNSALVSLKGITLIVNATVTHASPVYPGVRCVRVPVADVPSARLGDHFDRVAKLIHANRGEGTLVHCAAGMSRSPALVMAYLMRFRGVTLCQAHHWVRDIRPYVRLNEGFWEQLLRYEKMLYGKNTVKIAQDITKSLSVPLTPRTTRSARSMLPSLPHTQAHTQAHTQTYTHTQAYTHTQTHTYGLTQVPRSPVMSRSLLMTPLNKRRRGTRTSSVKI